MLNIHFRDMVEEVSKAIAHTFLDYPNIKVSSGNIFDHDADAIVSPANSFGYMDGGIDLHYLRYFGYELETNLKEYIKINHFGELPVGQAVIIPTGNERIPLLISAPTMRVPGAIEGTLNVYLAFRAALISIIRYNKTTELPISRLLVPGMGTGIGSLSAVKSALHIKHAYDSVFDKNLLSVRSPRQILNDHYTLIS